MRRVTIFAHYDPQNSIKRYVLHHLAALRGVCDEIHFASTSQLADDELAKLNGLATSYRLCENSGYDFGMWAQVIRMLAVQDWDELVLTNSSVFGPVGSIADAFDRMRLVDCDFWGMSDSIAVDYHLQSFFLVFRSSILRSGEIERFFASVLPYRHKWQVIRSYEVGLTHFLLDQGFVPAAAASVLDSRLRIGECNPCIRAPIALMNLGVPYVKVALLRDNPANIRLAPVRAQMALRGYPMDLVELDHQPRESILSGLLNQCHLLFQRWGICGSPPPPRPSISTKSPAGPANCESRQTPLAGPVPRDDIQLDHDRPPDENTP